MGENKKEESLIGNIIAYIAIICILVYIGAIIYVFIMGLLTNGFFDALGVAFVAALPLLVLGGIALWVND